MGVDKQITDWKNVPFELGRSTLRTWRETGARRSEECVELWEHVISRSPVSLGDEQWPVYEQVCIAALDCGKISLAVECIKILDGRFPASNRVMKLHAMKLEAQENYNDAMMIYDKLIEADPANNSFRKRRIAVLLAQNKRLAAIKELNEYLKTFLNDTESWMQLSELFLMENDLSKAAHCLEECLLVSPLNSMYIRRLADVRYTQGGVENVDLARAYYERAAKLNSNDLRAQYGIALCASYLSSQAKVGAEKKKAAQAGAAALESVIERYNKVKPDENPEIEGLVSTLQKMAANFTK